MGGEALKFVTKSETFEIVDYTFLKQTMRTKSCVQSRIFTAGGHKWAIEFYPRGTSSDHADYVSILVRQMHPRNDVRAMWTHRLQDRTTSSTKWSTDTPTSCTEPKTFRPNSRARGESEFIKRSNLEAPNSKYLINDKLVIKTTLWIVQE
jgi:speckle-type POZ protein